MSTSRYVALAGVIVRETDKAIHFSYFDTELERFIPIWIPLSQISHIVRGSQEENSIIRVAEWVLTKAGADYGKLTPEEQARLNGHKIQVDTPFDSGNYKSGALNNKSSKESS